MSSPSPGDAVRIVMTKWPKRPHWEFDAIFLGSDGAGDWIGIPAGTTMARPGAEYVAPVHQVGLAPARGRVGRGWLATFHAEGGVVHTYVDMTTPPYWTDLVLRAVDLDLDVVRDPNGRVWLDDEEEFARHQSEFDYPPVVVTLAELTAERVLTAVRDQAPPFDGTAATWLAELADRLGDGAA